MNQDTPINDWLRPRLAELVRQAERAGFARDTVVAVLTDLITASPFNAAATDSPPDG
jgi:mannose/fructose-specific phosphotransferase system component IIA